MVQEKKKRKFYLQSSRKGHAAGPGQRKRTAFSTHVEGRGRRSGVALCRCEERKVRRFGRGVSQGDVTDSGGKRRRRKARCVREKKHRRFVPPGRNESGQSTAKSRPEKRNQIARRSGRKEWRRRLSERGGRKAYAEGAARERGYVSRRKKGRQFPSGIRENRRRRCKQFCGPRTVGGKRRASSETERGESRFLSPRNRDKLRNEGGKDVRAAERERKKKEDRCWVIERGGH